MNAISVDPGSMTKVVDSYDVVATPSGGPTTVLTNLDWFANTKSGLGCPALASVTSREASWPMPTRTVACAVIVDVELPGCHAQGNIRRVTLEQVGTQREPHARHDGDSGYSMARDVSDDEREVRIVYLNHAVPVAADFDT